VHPGTLARQGIGSGKTLREGESGKFTSSQHRGTVSFVPLPSKRELAKLNEQALRNLRAPLLKAARLPARKGQPARPVPERVGEPSYTGAYGILVQEPPIILWNLVTLVLSVAILVMKIRLG